MDKGEDFCESVNYSGLMLRIFLLEFIVHLVFLLSLPWLLVQGMRRKGYLRHLIKRLFPAGATGTDSRPVVLVHGCSVGENMMIFPLVEELKGQYPALRIVHSAATDTGLELARKRSAADQIVAWPLENVVSNRRFLNIHRPQLVILAETEIWPDMLLALRSRKIPVIVVNGRLSDRSFPRYHRLRKLFAPALAAIRLFIAQSHLDAGRAVQIGIPPSRVVAAGNLKFDALSGILKNVTAPLDFGFPVEVPVFVFGSVHPGEEEAVMAMIRVIGRTNPAIRFIIAPRKLDRVGEYLNHLRNEGLPFTCRSQIQPGESVRTPILVLDTMGELVEAYRRGVAAFVGGSFVPTGGHNLLEVSAAGRYVYFGPYMHNFRDIEDLVLANSIGTRLMTVGQALQILSCDLADLEKLAAAGGAGQGVIRRQVGATARTLHLIRTHLPVFKS